MYVAIWCSCWLNADLLLVGPLTISTSLQATRYTVGHLKTTYSPLKVNP